MAHLALMKKSLKVLRNPLAGLSIRQKFFLMFLIITMALGSYGVYLFVQLNIVTQSFNNLDQRYARLKNVLTLEVDSQSLSNIVRAYLLNQNPSYQATYDRTVTDRDNNLASLDKNQLNASEAKAIDQYELVTDQLKGTELLILADVQQGSLAQARSLFDINYELQQADATSLITNLVNNESTNLQSTINQYHSQVGSIQRSLAGTLTLITIVVLIYIYLFSQGIISALRALTAATQKFTQGDFTARVDVTSLDEIGQLGSGFNDMAAQLSQTYTKLNQSLHETSIRTSQLGEEKARFASSIDSLPLGFMMTDASNTILKINPAMQQMLGIVSGAERIAEISRQLNESAGLLGQLLEHSQASLRSKKAINLNEIPNKSRLFRAFCSPVLLHEGDAVQTIGTAILVEDVTEERVMARSKDEFFSIASHELRTPLTAIRGNTSLIQQYYKEQLKDPQLNEMVGDIHDSSIRLIGIVNDFLDASRLEQGKMQFHPEDFSIENSIEQVVYEISGVAGEKKIAVRMGNNLGTLPMVRADKNKVKQIIYNLVGNALKFIDKGDILIGAAVNGKFLKVTVTDTGRGISPENQRILFHKFQQATSSIITRDTTRGTGLGLYISKLLIEDMGGKIALERSEVGKGSTFSFTVPLSTKASPTGASSAKSTN